MAETADSAVAWNRLIRIVDERIQKIAIDAEVPHEVGFMATESDAAAAFP